MILIFHHEAVLWQSNANIKNKHDHFFLGTCFCV